MRIYCRPICLLGIETLGIDRRCDSSKGVKGLNWRRYTIDGGPSLAWGLIQINHGQEKSFPIFSDGPSYIFTFTFTPVQRKARIKNSHKS